MGNRTYITGAIVLAVAVFFAINIFAGTALTRVRFDLTAQQLFTLSQGTRNVLQGLEEPVTLRFYLSRSLATQLPGTSSYISRVRSLLEEYAHLADGMIVLTETDPEPFSEEEDRAVAHGLAGIPLGDGESTFYFGLVGTNTLDDEEVISYFSPEREEFLEYDLTRLIHTLSQADAALPVVGLVGAMPLTRDPPPRAAMAGEGPQPWFVRERIEELFEVRELRGEDLEQIADDIDILLILHPKGLSDAALYAIDQFVLGGGHALVMVDPNAETDQVPNIPGLPPIPGKSELPELLEAWGVEVDWTQTVGDLQLALNVQGTSGDRITTVKFPPWFNVPAGLINREDVVTAQLGNLTFATPGALVALPDTELTVTPLVQTTPQGAALVSTDVVGSLADIEALLRDFRPDGNQYTLAARVSGTAASAFPEGRPEPEMEEEEEESEAGNQDEEKTEDEEEAPEPAPHLESGEVNLIVIADTDMLQDQFWVQLQEIFGQRMAVPIAGNGNFVINALENLTGSGDLISIRSRGSFLRPFTVINELRQEAELRYRAKEEELLARLEETENRLTELRTGEEGEVVLTEDQRSAIIDFTEQRVRIRRELRDVRHALRQDIESLESTLKFINIGLIPIVLGIGGLLAAALRARRRRVALRPAATASTTTNAAA